VIKSTICRTIKRLGYSRKRSVGASERDEWLRAAWKTMISTLDAQRLVFVDEMGTKAAKVRADERTRTADLLITSLRQWIAACFWKSHNLLR
jgi:hypothetical protein